MNKFLAIALFACLAAQVSGKPVVSGSQDEADFKSLEARLADNDDALSYIQKNIAGLEGGVKKAAQLVLDINNAGDGCTNDVLVVMNQIDAASLRANKLFKVSAAVDSGLKRARKTCEDHIEETYVRADGVLTNFYSTIKSIFSLGRADDDLIVENLRDLFEGHMFANFKHERTVHTGEMIVEKEKILFDYALNEYVLKPCQMVVSPDELENNLLALVKARAALKKQVQVDLEFDLKNVAWRKEVCEYMLNMDDKSKARLMELV